jgi:hypothetical protein
MADLQHPHLGADNPEDDSIVADSQLPVASKRTAQRRAVLLGRGPRAGQDGVVEAAPDIRRHARNIVGGNGRMEDDVEHAQRRLRLAVDRNT